MFFELPHPPVALPDGELRLVLVAGSTAQDQELEFVRIALEALADEPVRVLAAMNQPSDGDMRENGARVSWAGAGRMLSDRRLKARAAAIASWSRDHDGAARGAELIERLAEQR